MLNKEKNSSSTSASFIDDCSDSKFLDVLSLRLDAIDTESAPFLITADSATEGLCDLENIPDSFLREDLLVGVKDLLDGVSSSTDVGRLRGICDLMEGRDNICCIKARSKPPGIDRGT